MPKTPHVEKHFTASDTVRDIVIGMSDGLTVPFALAAGLSGAVALTSIVVTAGLAEIAAGSIAMGLGGYLAAKSDRDHYLTERTREKTHIRVEPEREMKEVSQIFTAYGLDKQQIEPIVQAFRNSPQRWVDFMMRCELGLKSPRRARRSAFTIALSYIGGGFIPLLPYMLVHRIMPALLISIATTLTALFIFGFIKGKFTGTHPWRGGLQTILIGGLAAAAAFVIAKWIG